MGVSCDSQHSHKAYSSALGNIPYPLLSDFWPHGEMSQAYELWDEERGISKRAVVIIDTDGVIAFRKVYERPDLPAAQDILAEVDKIR